MGLPIVGDNLLLQLATTPPLMSDVSARVLEISLKDFIAGALSGSLKYPELTRPGVSELANYLALIGSADDLDDVDWDVLTHPGSIIWPVLLAAHSEENQSLEKLYDAAYFGYRAGRSISRLLGASHRSNWHLTTTSGAVAATSALARFWNLAEEEHIAALKMALTTMTGSPLSGFERIGATQYNRAVATSLAITAVTSAQVNAPYIHDIWKGPRGVIAMYNAEESALNDVNETNSSQYLVDGLSTLHIRTYFATGFASAAIQGLLQILEAEGVPDSIEVTLAKGLATTLDGSRGGDWWNPEAIVRSVIANRNPFKIVGNQMWPGQVEIIFGDVSPGGAKISAHYGERTLHLDLENAPFRIEGLTDDSIKLVHEKWQHLTEISDFAEKSPSELLKKLLP